MLNALEYTPAGIAFDRLAADYDSIFTFSAVGMSQRAVVWKHAKKAFAPGSRILELNCGTGQDALFLAKADIQVTACDASPAMIEEARRKIALGAPEAGVQFFQLRSEELHRLPELMSFNGAFSNFSGLNCVRDLRSVSQQLAHRLSSGAPLLLCLSSRYCLWEITYFLLCGNPRKAFRRWSGVSEARIGDHRFEVFYPTLGQLREAFSPDFRLVSAVGIGIAVPPSYVESWIAHHPCLLRMMEAVDNAIRTISGLRSAGDHILLHLEKVQRCGR